MTLDEIRQDLVIMNDINWEMTPEEAVTLYLEWGNNWTHGKHLVRSKNDVSVYFVVNTWDDPPCIYLIRRNSDEAVELAKRYGTAESPSFVNGILDRVARDKSKL